MARKPKSLTAEELQRRKVRAADFAERVRDDPELAAQIEAESLEDYARHRGIELRNPQERRQTHMASLKELQAEIDEQQDRIDEAIAILRDAYTPEVSREDLAEAVGNAIDVLQGEEVEEEGEQGDEDED